MVNFHKPNHLYVVIPWAQTNLDLSKVHESFEFKSHDKYMHMVNTLFRVRVFIVAQSGQHFLTICIPNKVVLHIRVVANS